MRVIENNKENIVDFAELEPGDLDSRNLAIIEIKPIFLNQTDSRISNPDLCKECIIKVLRG